MDEVNKRALMMGRRAGKSFVSQWAREYDTEYLPALTVDAWLKLDITDTYCRLYPNAKKAAELKKTKLYKALK